MVGDTASPSPIPIPTYDGCTLNCVLKTTYADTSHTWLSDDGTNYYISQSDLSPLFTGPATNFISSFTIESDTTSCTESHITSVTFINPCENPTATTISHPTYAWPNINVYLDSPVAV